MKDGEKKKYEKYKRIYRMFSAILIVVMESVLYWKVWFEYYNERTMNPFAQKGNFVMLFLYVFLLVVFINFYGGIKIGYEKTTSMVFSQGLAVICSNIFIYLIIVLLTRGFPELVPVLALTLTDIIGIGVLVFILNRIYHSLFPARKLLMIYGDYRENARLLAHKMEVRDDKYQVGEFIRADEPMDTLIEKMNAYEGVVLCEVHSVIRNRIIKYCYGACIRVYVTPNISDIILRGAENLHFFDTPLLLARNSGLSIEQKLMKRCMDLLISAVGIIISSPFMLLTAAAIKLYDKGPVFFRQARVTNGGKIFYITKFRSMIVDAEKDGRVIPATERDPRITPVGRVIRATRLDELPQLFDIFVGNMSIVGPRPERVEHVEKYTAEIPEFSYRLKVKGGLTGYAQIYGKYNTTAYDKLKLDLMYIENYSILLDIRLILLTIKIMFMKESTEGFTEEKSAEMQENKK